MVNLNLINSGMTETQRIICEYCNTPNPWEASTCLACGGPISQPKVDLTIKATTVETPPKSEDLSKEDIQKIGEKADDVYFTVLNTYTIAWRTIGEAISIALTGFILGFVGGTTGMYFPGVLGAILIGLAVGLTHKQFYLVLISAPVGLLLGLGFGAFSWMMGGESQIMVFTGMVGAVIGAILGGRRNPPFSQRNCWEKARPLLGAMGGFAFGLLGTLIGWGIRETVKTIMTIV
jgi:hypothetical protein